MPNIRIQTHTELKPEIFQKLASAIDEVFKRRGIFHTDTMHTPFGQYAIGSKVVEQGDARCRAIVQVEMGSGRPEEMVADIAKDVSKSVSEILGIKLENVDLYLFELPPNRFYSGGKKFQAPHPAR